MGPRHPPFGLPSQSTGGAAAGTPTVLTSPRTCEVFGTTGSSNHKEQRELLILSAPYGK